jgi:hypothetical protein
MNECLYVCKNTKHVNFTELNLAPKADCIRSTQQQATTSEEIASNYNFEITLGTLYFQINNISF